MTLPTPHIPGRADITVVMITVDRSPKRNYLKETIDNLTRGGVFTSERLSSFTLLAGQSLDSMSSDYLPLIASPDRDINSLSSKGRPLPCENAGRALVLGSKLASRHSNGWVLFLEDDIDCCSDFLGSVGRWLDQHSNKPGSRSALYQFGCSHLAETGARDGAWQYTSAFDFYGTQAIAIRPSYAQAIGTIIAANPAVYRTETGSRLLPSEYDLMIGHWAALGGYNICASVPSFVQHIGQDSSLSSRPFCHTFPSWPGREWSYK